MLETEYKNSMTLMKCLCTCGKEAKISVDGVRRGIRCYTCAKEVFLGENNVNWNPNLTDEERELRRRTPGNRQWIIDVHRKSDYTCFVCEVRGAPELHAHHIMPYSTNEDLRMDISNGTTMCSICHHAYHGVYKLEEVNLNTLIAFKETLNKRNEDE